MERKSEPKKKTTRKQSINQIRRRESENRKHVHNTSRKTLQEHDKKIPVNVPTKTTRIRREHYQGLVFGHLPTEKYFERIRQDIDKMLAARDERIAKTCRSDGKARHPKKQLGLAEINLGTGNKPKTHEEVIKKNTGS